MRRAALLLIAGLAACSTQPPPAPQAMVAAPPALVTRAGPAARGTPAAHAASARMAAHAAPAVCRIGPDGGPLLSERGIGGTGAPAERLADRGIGGTGIVGVITGFGSVCVNGLEVPYDTSSAVDIDGARASPADLRVGQVVAILAESRPASAVARTISVRHDVSGRIEAVALDTGMVTIAGQSVVIGAGTEDADRFGLGDWVSVGGLRRADGVLVASRLDSATQGHLTAHGRVTRQNDALRVGSLVLPTDTTATPGQYVTVTGETVAGQDRVISVTTDALAANPGAYFGTSVSHLVVQGFVRFIGGMVKLNGLDVHAGPGVRGAREGMAIVSLERGPDGSFAAVGMRFTDQPGARHGTPSGGAPASSPPLVAVPRPPAAGPALPVGAIGPRGAAGIGGGSTQQGGDVNAGMPPGPAPSPISIPSGPAAGPGPALGNPSSPGSGIPAQGIPIAANSHTWSATVKGTIIAATFMSPRTIQGASGLIPVGTAAATAASPALTPTPTMSGQRASGLIPVGTVAATAASPALMTTPTPSGGHAAFGTARGGGIGAAKGSITMKLR